MSKLNIKTIGNEIFNTLYDCGLISKLNYENPIKVDFSCCSRTDKGVHSIALVNSVKLLIDYSIKFPIKNIEMKISEKLPSDICLYSATLSPSSFNARKCSVGRKYCYYLPLSIFKDSSQLNMFIELINIFKGNHDFSNFSTFRPKPHIIDNYRSMYKKI